MNIQSMSFSNFRPFGAKLREQTAPLSDVKPVGAEILEQTRDSLTIRVPKSGGGVLLTGPRGGVGGVDWSAANWLAMDVNYPQPEQFALCLCIGVYRYDQDFAQEAPQFGMITGAFPNYPTRISLDFRELACRNGFLPRTPGKLKTVAAGLPIRPDEISALYIGARECHVEQVIQLKNLFLSDEEPDYPMQPVKMVDELGQWTLKDWPGKTHSIGEMVKALNDELEAPPPPLVGNRSKWGGNMDLRLTEGTGFYAKHRDSEGCWWLVDPEGYAYFVMGLEGVSPSSSAVVNEWADSYTWLPEREGEFAEAWSEFRGNPDEGRRVAYSENIDFSIVNLIRAYGKDWKKKWARLTLNRLNAWGINNVGVSGSPRSIMPSPLRDDVRLPAFHMMRGFPRTQSCVFRDFPDVFSPEYRVASEKFAAQLGEIKGDPYIVGYFMTNEPEWAFIEGLEISEMLLGNPAPLETKRVFLHFLQEKYADIRAFNAAWNLDLASFEELMKPIADARRLSADAARDLDAFSRIMIEEYVRVPAAACKSVDPNHMNFGLRYPYILYPNQTAGYQYLDVFDINDYRYDPLQYVEWLGSIVDRPILVSEFHHGALDRGLPVTGIRGVRTQEDRGKAYRYYVERAASTRYFVGSIYFIFEDQPVLCTHYQENYNIGFVDICQKPHGEITAAVRETAQRIYDVHGGSVPPFDEKPEIIPLNAC